MNEEQLEDALRNWPLAETPAGFSTAVMERIAPQQSHTRILQKSELRFRLTWMDFALGMFLSCMPVLGLVAIRYLPQGFILSLKYQWLLLQFPGFEPALLAFAGTMVMLFLLAMLLILRSVFPRHVSYF
jgi:hypothetical protein